MASDYGDEAGGKLLDWMLRIGQEAGAEAMTRSARELSERLAGIRGTIAGGRAEQVAAEGAPTYAKLSLEELSGLPEYATIKEIVSDKLRAASVEHHIIPGEGHDWLLFKVEDAPEVDEAFRQLEQETGKAADRARVALFASMSDTDSTFDFLFALLMDTAVSALCAEALETHGGSLPTTVHFVFDEFANIGRIPDFERTIAVTRSRNIAVSMIAQSLSQLKETYGDNNAETIMNACDTLLYLGGKANETNEEISKMAGKQTVASETQSDSRGAGWTRTVNRGISERDLIQPAEVARMPREDALVLVNGCMPLMDRKYRLERHPRSRLLEEAARRGPFDFAEYRRRKEGDS